ncbi:MAG: hypothetical protein IJV80_06255, partial [Clostridia bacterium]|nr:hypothetical protein [Clostridia bacterium]
ITPYLKEGENAVAIHVWYFGGWFSRTFVSPAGLIFEIQADGKTVCASGENTLARKSRAYESGRKQAISGQLGWTFFYNATGEDCWKTTGTGMKNAVVREKNCTFYPRPIFKHEIKALHAFKIVEQSADKKHYLVDLGEEVVGYPYLALGSSSANNRLVVAYGELLENGKVKQKIGNRNFSFEYVAKAGENDFSHYMLRLACRYLEIFAEEPIELTAASLYPQTYPVKVKEAKFENELDQRIYDVCVNTLKLCMMEHYVDCPWREQSLYVFDSRNQMLCGYNAFEGGNTEYARANLKLMSKDRRKDNLLAICYPTSTDLTIPSFSLHYFTAILEYAEQTGDLEFVKEVYPKLLSVIGAFVAQRKDGLVCRFGGENHWNFYDWSDYLEGELGKSQTAIPDLMVNVLFVIALENFQKIAEKIGETFLYNGILEETRNCARKAFYSAEKGAFTVLEGTEQFTVLGNALAVLAGMTNQAESEAIAEKIQAGEFTDCSLSMKMFKYDALLKTDEEKYAEQVLNEIRADYKMMLDAGSTTVWETLEGAKAFGNSGSLCHGWSAVPVYYFHKLLKK